MRWAAVVATCLVVCTTAGCDREPARQPTALPTVGNVGSEHGSGLPLANTATAPPERPDTLLLRALAASAPIARFEPCDEGVRIVGADGLVFESILTWPALDGTPLSAPVDGFPAVLIIPPDSAGNADGALASGHLDIAPYRDLAHDLCARGFVVLRMQPRAAVIQDGAGTITGRSAMLRAIRVDALSADIDAHWTWLGARGDIDAARTAVLAHATGCLLACAWLKDRAVPLVLVACPAARPLDAIARRQADARVAMLESLMRGGRMDAGIALARERTKRDRVQRAFEAIRVDANAMPQTQRSAAIAGLPDTRGEAYWRAMLQLSDGVCERIAELARRVPILALHGDQDLTYLPDHVLALADAQRGAPDHTRAVLAPTVNHWLVSVDAEAADAGRVDALVLAAIAGWLATTR